MRQASTLNTVVEIIFAFILASVLSGLTGLLVKDRTFTAKMWESISVVRQTIGPHVLAKSQLRSSK